MDCASSVFTEAMKDSLKEKRAFLVNNLTNVAGIMDYLEQGGVFPDSEDVLCNMPPKQQKRALLDRLVKRPASDYWIFIRCLYEDDVRQGNIAGEILSVYEGKGGRIPLDVSILRQDYLDRQNSELTGPQPRQTFPQQSGPSAISQPSNLPLEFHPPSAQPQPQPTPQAPTSFEPQRSTSGNVIAIDSRSLEQQQHNTQQQQQQQQQPGREAMETDSGDQGQQSALPCGAQCTEAAASGDESAYHRDRRQNPEKVYKMESTPRGLALIINNESFDNLDQRHGAEQDRTQLEDCLKNVLDFDVTVKSNLKAQDMLHALKEFSQNPILAEVDSCIIVVMSHGSSDDVIFGTDGRVERHPQRGTYITIHQINNLFSNLACPNMSNKPKLLFIQACRGNLEDTMEGLVPAAKDVALMDRQACRTVGAYCDMARLHATVPGMVAYRHTLIPVIVDVFTKNAATLPFQNMVTEINRQMANIRLQGGAFISPEAGSTLLKTLYFNPPSS
ncbi:hypothetical protein ACOMHN_017619 [Nucella lapillus]